MSTDHSGAFERLEMFEMEDLLPIISDLAAKQMGKHSTSITYEHAQQLMEAVFYCMNEVDELGGLVVQDETAEAREQRERLARQIYDAGYKAVLSKVRRAKLKYSVLIANFNSYGNRNLYDTVARAIPGFFKFYSPEFAPQDTIITMDYPTREPISGKSGIDAIEEYIEKITEEQQFLAEFPPGMVEDVLRAYARDYRSQFFNLTDILFLMREQGMPIDSATRP